MTDKELRKLKRSDLLEILFYLQKEVETLKAENELLQQRLQECSIVSLSQTQLQALMTHISDSVQKKLTESPVSNDSETEAASDD